MCGCIVVLQLQFREVGESHALGGDVVAEDRVDDITSVCGTPLCQIRPRLVLACRADLGRHGSGILVVPVGTGQAEGVTRLATRFVDVASDPSQILEDRGFARFCFGANDCRRTRCERRAVEAPWLGLEASLPCLCARRDSQPPRWHPSSAAARRCGDRVHISTRHNRTLAI